MRLFQNSGMYPSYLKRLDSLSENTKTFSQRLDVFLNDRYGACHFLLPVLNHEPSSFFTNGDDETLQRRWAIEQGMLSKSTLEDILLAQIEQHRTEVFYNLDPMRYGGNFVRKLPGCVKISIAWRAAPSPNIDLKGYNLIVCNFPSIIDGYRQKGLKSMYFSPAHDMEMDSYAINQKRPIDVLFIGGYTRHHQRRAQLLCEIASLSSNYNVKFCLDISRLTRLSESALGRILPLSKYRRSQAIINISHAPVFGRELYETISQSKIVLNVAIDMAGNDRGNMRCFEAMGCGALMLSDEGVYPEGMIDGVSMMTYKDSNDAITKVHELLKNDAWHKIADNGYRMMADYYSKANQLEKFMKLVEICS